MVTPFCMTIDFRRKQNHCPKRIEENETNRMMNYFVYFIENILHIDIELKSFKHLCQRCQTSFKEYFSFSVEFIFQYFISF